MSDLLALRLYGLGAIVERDVHRVEAVKCLGQCSCEPDADATMVREPFTRAG
jgi:hypothetical protein